MACSLKVTTFGQTNKNIDYIFKDSAIVKCKLKLTSLLTDNFMRVTFDESNLCFHITMF